MNNFIKSFKNLRGFNKIEGQYKNIVFFSESNNYSFFFKSLIDSLLDKNIKITYVAADNNDIFLNYKNHNLKTICISNFFLLQYFFSNIKCNNLILTMPDLGNGIINKSPFCKKYIYIFHSLISLNVAYKKNSFDNYDIFLSPTKIHTSEIQDKFGNSKKIIDVGYPKIEDLKNKINSNIESDGILIAPTWGKDSCLYSQNLIHLIEKLIEKNFQVEFRPHPMSFSKDKKKIDEIVNKYKLFSKFKLNTEDDNIKIFLNSKILITDWSGSAMEFSLAKEKPSLFINTSQRIRNNTIKKGDKILETTFEYLCRDEIGVVLDANKIENIENIIKDFEINKDFYKKKILSFKRKYFHDNENSLKKSVSKLIELTN